MQELATPAVLVRALIGRCKAATNVMRFYRLWKISHRTLQRDLDVLGEDDEAATTLVDSHLLGEARGTAPDWNQCLQVLDEIALDNCKAERFPDGRGVSRRSHRSRGVFEGLGRTH